MIWKKCHLKMASKYQIGSRKRGHVYTLRLEYGAPTTWLIRIMMLRILKPFARWKFSTSLNTNLLKYPIYASVIENVLIWITSRRHIIHQKCIQISTYMSTKKNAYVIDRQKHTYWICVTNWALIWSDYILISFSQSKATSLATTMYYYFANHTQMSRENEAIIDMDREITE